MNTDAKIYEIGLTKLPKVGPVLAKSLIAHCGSAKQVFSTPLKALLKIEGIGLETATAIVQSDALNQAESELEFAINEGIDVLYYLDEAYPKRLKNFDYSPIVLYYKGNADLNPDKTVGIVGTRNPTEYGRVMCEKIVEDLSRLEVTTVSGLAFGIDGVAHKSSIDQGMNTIGVLGHGLDMIYPPEHRKLSSRMVNNGGLLTEFGINTRPDRQNFPMRNRIIAALSDAIIVVESKAKGGSIITAEIANEYNKDVFAVPGKPDDEHSAGCNGLIKRTKAHLMESVADLQYIMRWDEDQEKVKPVQASLFVDLSDEERCVVDIIKEAKEISIDDLSYAVQQNLSTLASNLLNLEFKGLVKSLPGKRYMVR